ncbi:hypothetical protein EDB19DRAFT_1836813 [Suillus lakei]|nr:hypothetical protein EDB19DRAFT_1836813 [Suillus lakei]
MQSHALFQPHPGPLTHLAFRAQDWRIVPHSRLLVAVAFIVMFDLALGQACESPTSPPHTRRPRLAFQLQFIARPQYANFLIQSHNHTLGWHIKRKMGKLILDKGSVVNRFGELIGFMVLPAVDVDVALVVRFELALGASVVLTRYKTSIRKRMDKWDAYLGGEEYEAQRHTDAIEEYQTLERRVVLSLNLFEPGADVH